MKIKNLILIGKIILLYMKNYLIIIIKIFFMKIDLKIVKYVEKIVIIMIYIFL